MLYTKSRSNGPSRTVGTPPRGSVMMTRAGVRTLASHGGRVLPLSPLEGEWSSRGGAAQTIACLNRSRTEASAALALAVTFSQTDLWCSV